jgi:predicted phosphoribosyltransferase
MTDITFNGMTMEFNVVENMMDAELKGVLLAKLGNPSEQELLDAYLIAHKEKFGSDFLQG